ncbi:MAG: TIGR03862 family flavoprotein [Bacteroidia bacterium]|nr:TIGR03862 family flavoprotein [Bacteroidia bacterium]
MSKQNITIIGGGPASLMLACSLDASKFNISIYEKNAALGRKFLVAGKGGFNLTHSENLEQFIERYHPKQFIEPFLKHFSNTDFRDWLQSIGIETYVGTSKRVFPVKGIKPIEVLNGIEAVLKKNMVSIHYNHEWKGWSNHDLLFLNNGETKIIKFDIVVFALGGASWKVTGSAGDWTSYIEEKGIQINSFYPSNCAYKINSNQELLKHISGHALKNCEFSCGVMHKKGEAVLTDFGIEGSGIYGLSKEIRLQLIEKQKSELLIDFKPELSLEEIQNRFENRGKLSIKDILEKKINLSAVQIQLLKYQSTKEEYNQPKTISQLIKKFPLILTDFAPIDDAISTVGGIALGEVTENLELKKLPNHYCLGEMLDWDAPTGGYLLQACFSMGKFVADKLNQKL